jgi:hypothetical protein
MAILGQKQQYWKNIGKVHRWVEGKDTSLRGILGT